MKKRLTVLALSILVCLSAIGLVACKPTPPETTHYSYAQVVSMMTDMENLALLPNPTEVGAAATSYDRASYYDKETDSYVLWGDEFNMGGVTQKSNKDGEGYIEKVDGGILAADIKGTGVIVRSFFATPSAGDIEIYIDGSTTPQVDMPLIDFVTADGRYEGLDNMVYITDAQGYNNYVPITFNSSCKIILKSGWGKYYHFSYKLFGENVTVDPLGETFTQEQQTALNNANEVLGGELAPTYANEVKALDSTIKLTAGQTTTIFEDNTKNAITNFRVKLNDEDISGPLNYAKYLDVLQKLELAMYWDGETSPSVWAPLGDFFANPGGNDFETAVMGKENGFFYSHFYMPYKTGAKIVIKNLNTEDYDIEVEIYTAPVTKNIDELGRFHAKWKMDDRNQATHPDRYLEYVTVKTEGKGRFLGFNLHVYKFGDSYWWGEGDEKFYVDGEKSPSTFGTGSEDYFGYAWCDPSLFDNAFHAQNWTAGNFISAVGNYNNVRFQILDSVPFQTSFEGTIEKLFREDQTSYASTAYWYLEAGGVDPYEPVEYTTKAQKEYRYQFVNDMLNAEEAQKSSKVYEGEDLEVYEIVDTDSKTNPVMATYPNANFSGGEVGILRFTKYKELNKLNIKFLVWEDFAGKVNFTFAKANNFGIINVYIDGVKVLENIDLYAGVAAINALKSDVYATNDINLTRGEHILTVELVGKNDSSSDVAFGLDCFALGNATISYEKPEKTTGNINFENVKVGYVFAGTNVDLNDNIFASLSSQMGDGVLRVLNDGKDYFARIHSKGVANKYAGLRLNFTNGKLDAGTYKVTIVMRTSANFELQPDKSIVFRLYSGGGDVKIYDKYQNASADANGWRTVEFDVTNAIDVKECWIFTYANVSNLDVKSVSIVKK